MAPTLRGTRDERELSFACTHSDASFASPSTEFVIRHRPHHHFLPWSNANRFAYVVRSGGYRPARGNSKPDAATMNGRPAMKKTSHRSIHGPARSGRAELKANVFHQLPSEAQDNDRPVVALIRPDESPTTRIVRLPGRARCNLPSLLDADARLVAAAMACRAPTCRPQPTLSCSRRRCWRWQGFKPRQFGCLDKNASTRCRAAVARTDVTWA